MEGTNLGIGDRVYTELDIIKLRKIRDTLGVVWQNPKLNNDEKMIIEKSVMEIAGLPGVSAASQAANRGMIDWLEEDGYCPDPGWKAYF